MDVSSRYFTLLKKPGLYWLLYLWRFLETVHRVGKRRELVSFARWEVIHRLRLYQLSKLYLKFTDSSYLVLADTSDLSGEQVVAGRAFRPVPIDWKYCIETADSLLWGCRFSHPNALYCSDDQSESAILVYEFHRAITSFFISRQGSFFVCSDGVIYQSNDRGRSFRVTLRLSTPISYFLFNSGMTELPDGTLLIGEYGSIWHGRAWQNLAYLYYSADSGKIWHTSDFLIRQGVNKHIHLVRYSPLLDALFLTDGDNKKQAWVNKTLSHFDQQFDEQTNGWHLLNRHHHQTGGYTSVAETEKAVLFGSDYLGGTNFIVRTVDGSKFERLVLPDPYRRSPIMNMVTRHTSTSTEIWAVSYSCLSGKAKSLLMCTNDSGKTWSRVIEFDGTKVEVRLINIPHHSADTLYISVTRFGQQGKKHHHKIYKLEDHSLNGIKQMTDLQIASANSSK